MCIYIYICVRYRQSISFGQIEQAASRPIEPCESVRHLLGMPHPEYIVHSMPSDSFSLRDHADFSCKSKGRLSVHANLFKNLIYYLIYNRKFIL